VTKTTLIRRSLILPMLVIVGIGSVACTGGGVTGNATTPPTTSVTANPVAAIDPCSLLSQSDMTSLGLTSTGPEKTVKSRGCGWQKAATYSIGIYADPSQGIDVLRASNSTTASLQSHDAIQTANSGIDCLFDIAITKTSAVGISIEAGVGNACQLAQQYATLIEPKLPAQQK
jgi:hypothetical protein